MPQRRVDEGELATLRHQHATIQRLAMVMVAAHQPRHLDAARIRNKGLSSQRP